MAYSSSSITAPNSAIEGERVSISVKVTNTSADSYEFRIRLLAVRDIYAVPSPEEEIGSLEVVIRSGQSQIVSGSFIMPAWDAIVIVMVHRLNDYWDFDHYTTKTVSVEALVPEPEPTDEELIYANWLRTGGTGTIEYWRSLGSPLYYTPEPEPEPEYPSTDIKDIIISVVGPEYPATDIKDIIISIVGVEYPATDIKDIAISVVGIEYPVTDIKDITINVVGIPVPPGPPEEEEEKFPWVPAALIAGGVGLMVAGGIETKKAKGG